jgi:hypothetical protein
MTSAFFLGLQREVQKQKQQERAQKDVQRVLQNASESENKLGVALKVRFAQPVMCIAITPNFDASFLCCTADRTSEATTGATEQAAQQEEKERVRAGCCEVIDCCETSTSVLGRAVVIWLKRLLFGWKNLPIMTPAYM